MEYWLTEGGTPLYDGIGDMIELKDQLIKAKLDWQFPFNTGEQKAHNYWKDCEDEVQHLNLKRIAWVRDQVEKIKEL